MTREEVRTEVLKIKNKNILCELPTSFGKTKIALDWIKKRTKGSILIVIPRLVLIDTWKEEFHKWNMEDYLSNVEFVTYVSFFKKAGEWDTVIFDEVHHLSERCQEALAGFKIKRCMMLSATVSRDLKDELKGLFSDLNIYKVTARQAIENDILPDPKVYLVELFLDNRRECFEIVKNKTQRIELRVPYSKRWQYTGIKNRRLILSCTQRQYYDDMSSLILWYKKKMRNEIFKNMFLRKSGDRLKWLSDQKAVYVREILDLLKDYRTLTFCNGIQQTEELVQYCVNSSNNKSEEYLQMFNDGKIDHITACNMLDEGVNLTACRVGIYAVLNSSTRMIKQKLGRLLRHPEPIIIIPYFKYTREAEIVEDMLEDYNPELVSKVSLEELKEVLGQ